MKCFRCHAELAQGVLICAHCGTEQLGVSRPAVPEPGDLEVSSRTPPDVSLGFPTPPSTRRGLRVGERLLDRYRVTGELGEGGMGVVYKCFDDVGLIEVALKTLPRELSHNRVEMEEVRQNFRMIERLHHPNIAAAKTLEQDARTGDYFLILEYVSGLDWRQWQRQHGPKANLDSVLPHLRQVAGALDYAHSQGIVHRDVKPSNVVIRPDGVVKVLDFGLAEQIRTSLARASRVHFATSGTAFYMAPEQWQGKFQDGRADQYALAVMAYESLAGRLPFESSNLVVLREAVMKESPDRIAGLSGIAWKALARALAKDRSARFNSCCEFVAALAGKSAKTSARPPQDALAAPVPQAGGAWKKRVALLAAGFAAAAAVGLAGWEAWEWGVNRPRQAALDQLKRLREEVAGALDRHELASAQGLLTDLEHVAGPKEGAAFRARYDEQLLAIDREKTRPLQKDAEAARAVAKAAQADADAPEQWKQAETKFGEANRAFDANQFAAAGPLFKASIPLYDQARAAAEAARAFRAARADFESLAGRNQELLATYGGTNWTSAQQLVAQAQAAGENDPKTGRDDYLSAAALLDPAVKEARQRAEDRHAFLNAREAYQRLAGDAPTAALLKQQATNQWAHIGFLVKQAEAAGEAQPQEGARLYGEAATNWTTAAKAVRSKQGLDEARGYLARNDFHSARDKIHEVLRADQTPEAGKLLAEVVAKEHGYADQLMADARAQLAADKFDDARKAFQRAKASGLVSESELAQFTADLNAAEYRHQSLVEQTRLRIRRVGFDALQVGEAVGKALLLSQDRWTVLVDEVEVGTWYTKDDFDKTTPVSPGQHKVVLRSGAVGLLGVLSEDTFFHADIEVALGETKVLGVNPNFLGGQWQKGK